jgi:hypothetical protein
MAARAKTALAFTPFWAIIAGSRLEKSMRNI